MLILNRAEIVNKINDKLRELYKKKRGYGWNINLGEEILKFLYDEDELKYIVIEEMKEDFELLGYGDICPLDREANCNAPCGGCDHIGDNKILVNKNKALKAEIETLKEETEKLSIWIRKAKREFGLDGYT